MKSNFIKSGLLLIALICNINSNGQTSWTKHVDNPVLTKGPDNFDIIAIGQPTTLFENDTIKMWYGGVAADMKARICYAYSLDGINWTKHNSPVLEVGNSGEWDRGWLDTPEIVKDNTGYKMYYYGDTVQQFSAISSAIGVAYSTDGINWTKDINNPIFTKGNIGDWDGSWIESPAILFDSLTGEYKMWYNGVDTSTWKINIGLATSTDGVSWTKYINNPVIQTGNWGAYDDMWLGTPAVCKTDNYYELWYSATSTNSYNYTTASFDTVSICYATSIDGINWDKHTDNPLFHTFTAPYDSSVDRGGPWAPSVIFNPNTNNYMMWFEANGANSDFSISFATAPKSTSNISENYDKNSDVIVYPNPFNSSATIYIKDNVNNASLKIFNFVGQTVYSQLNIDKQKIKIERNTLTRGVYFYNILNNNKIVNGRLIVD